MATTQQIIEQQRQQLQQAQREAQARIKKEQFTKAQLFQKQTGLAARAKRQAKAQLQEQAKQQIASQVEVQRRKFETEVAKVAPEYAQKQYLETAYKEARTSLEAQKQRVASELKQKQEEFQKVKDQVSASTYDKKERRIFELQSELGIVSGYLKGTKESAVKGFYSGNIKRQIYHAEQKIGGRYERMEAKASFAEAQGFKSFAQYQKAFEAQVRPEVISQVVIGPPPTQTLPVGYSTKEIISVYSKYEQKLDPRLTQYEKSQIITRDPSYQRELSKIKETISPSSLAEYQRMAGHIEPKPRIILPYSGGPSGVMRLPEPTFRETAVSTILSGLRTVGKVTDIPAAIPTKFEVTQPSISLIRGIKYTPGLAMTGVEVGTVGGLIEQARGGVTTVGKVFEEGLRDILGEERLVETIPEMVVPLYEGETGILDPLTGEFKPPREIILPEHEVITPVGVIPKVVKYAPEVAAYTFATVPTLISDVVTSSEELKRLDEDIKVETKKQYEAHLEEELPEGFRHLTMEEFELEQVPNIRKAAEEKIALEAGISLGFLGGVGAYKVYKAAKPFFEPKMYVSELKPAGISEVPFATVSPPKGRVIYTDPFSGKTITKELYDISGLGKRVKPGRKVEVTTKFRKFLGKEPYTREQTLKVLRKSADYSSMELKSIKGLEDLNRKDFIKKLVKKGIPKSRAAELFTIEGRIKDTIRLRRPQVMDDFFKGEATVKYTDDTIEFFLKGKEKTIPAKGEIKGVKYLQKQPEVRFIDSSAIPEGEYFKVLAQEELALLKEGKYPFTKISKLGKTKKTYVGLTGAEKIKDLPTGELYRQIEIGKQIIPKKKPFYPSETKIFVGKGEPPITIIDTSVTTAVGFPGGKVKSSKQFLEQLYRTEEALVTLIPKPKPIAKIPKPSLISKAKVVDVKPISAIALPRMVGGKGLDVIPYEGTGLYEVTEVSAVSLPGVIKYDMVDLPTIDVKPRTTFETIQIQQPVVGLGIKEELKITPEFKVIQELKPELAKELLVIQKPEFKIQQVQITEISERLKQEQLLRISERLKQELKLKTELKLQQVQVPRLGVVQVLRVVPRPPTPRLKLKFVPILPRRKFPALRGPRLKPETLRQGYNFEVRRKGKWERFKTPYAFATKEGAEASAQDVVLTEAAASYKIVKSRKGKKVVKSGKKLSPFKSFLFRPSKKEKGVKVQKKKLRILSKGEKEQISYAGGIARMKKSKLTFKNIPKKKKKGGKKK